MIKEKSITHSSIDCILSNRKNSLLFGVFVFVINFALLFGAAALEETFFMDGANQGLLELPGVIGILIGDMFIMVAAQKIVHLSKKIVRKFPSDRSPVALRYLRYSRTKMIKCIYLTSGGKKLYFNTAGFAFFFWINNIVQTSNPFKYYGCDVFGSTSNYIGFVATKIFFFLSWVVLLPYMACVGLIVLFTFYKAIQTMRRHGKLYFDVFHSDGRGGFSFLAEVNITFISGIIIIYIELILVLFQHRHFNPGLISGFALATVMLVIGTFVMLFPLRGYLRKKEISIKYMCERELNKKFDIEKYSILSRVNDVSFAPYSGQEKVFLNGIRVISVSITLSRAYFYIVSLNV